MVNLHPIGYISMHAGDHDAYGVIRAWIMTDHGWRPADGSIYDRSTYPRLWEALPDRRRGDFVEVPDMRPGRVELGTRFESEPMKLTPAQMPAHTHNIAPIQEVHHNHKFDPYFMQRHSHGYVASIDPASGLNTPVQLYRNVRVGRDDVIGNVESVVSNQHGVSVKMQLNDYFTEHLKKGMLRVNDLDSLFPEIHAIKDMKWGDRRTSNLIKENSMTIKLKTPSETIERKDLTVALELMGTSDRDYLLDAIALVQELGDDETMHRARDHKDDGVSFLDSHIRVAGTKIAGLCTDVQGGQYSDEPVQFVVDGKIEKLKSTAYVIVKLEAPEPLGEDTLRVVRD